MSRLDDLIEKTLIEDDEDMASTLLREPGYFEQAFGLFTGRLAWVNWLMMIIQSLIFFVSIWLSFKFFAATTVLEALRWGLPCAVMMLSALTMKMALLPQMTTNRLLLEMRRMELRIERLRSEHD